MNGFGQAWLLDRAGNCREVYGHPSASFEFDSIVDLVEKYGSNLDKWNCREYRKNSSDELKEAILYAYDETWCKVRLWWDNKLTFRISSTDFNWYNTIVEFLLNHPAFKNTHITVDNRAKKIYWDDVSYQFGIDPANEAILSTCFNDLELVTL